MRAVDPTNDDIESYDQACEKAISNGYSAMVDLTWGGWDAMQDVANANGCERGRCAEPTRTHIE